MYQEIIQSKNDAFTAAIDHFSAECTKLRTGRANPALVENLLVDQYGTKTPLKQAANLSVPEARQILIQPWDKSLLDHMESVLKKADLGGTITNDGTQIRILLPPMTEDNRHDLVKVLNQKAEEARISIRAIREEIWKEITHAQQEKTITEDEKFAGKEALQEVVDAHNATIEELRKKKEEEIMTV